MTVRRHADPLIAALLALVLGLVWAWRDWSNLAQLRLPDTDDVMRLQQVRDWLAGQRFADLAQHRLAGGLPMHWSRLADLGPAALIAGLAPLAGRHGAEVAAVIAWPLLLFAAALYLVGRIARAVGGAAIAGPAMVVAAIAYPATTIFLPGRIDHHGLQVVLLLGATLGLLHRRPRTTDIAGLCAGASLIVGLETAPLLGMLGLAAVIDWIAGGPDADERLAGFGVGALAALLVGRVVFAGDGFAYRACDGFTADAWAAALTLTAAPILLSGIGGQVTRRRARTLAALAIGGGIAAVALLRSPDCLSPYGRVDPLLARLWLTHVGEAQSILTAPLATTLGYGGVMVAGLAATAWQAHRRGSATWGLLALLLLAAVATSAVQLRGAYAGAMLAAPGLAAVIVAARRKSALALAGAWLASAGMLYPLAADALTPAPAPGPGGIGDCSSPQTLAALARLPRGTVFAPIDAGPLILATTAHRILAAPYHRDTAGNLAMYEFYLGRPATAARTARALHVDYILACAAMPGATRPGTTAAALGASTLPGFTRVARSDDGATIVASDRLSPRG